MKELMRAGGCGTSDLEAGFAFCDAMVKDMNFLPWPEPVTRNHLAQAKAGGTPDPVDGLLLLEEYLELPEGTAGTWYADPAVQAAISRGELLFWPGGPLGCFFNPVTLHLYLQEFEQVTPEEEEQEIRVVARVLPPYISQRLGMAPRSSR